MPDSSQIFEGLAFVSLCALGSCEAILSAVLWCTMGPRWPGDQVPVCMDRVVRTAIDLSSLATHLWRFAYKFSPPHSSNSVGGNDCLSHIIYMSLTGFRYFWFDKFTNDTWIKTAGSRLQAADIPAHYVSLSTHYESHLGCISFVIRDKNLIKMRRKDRWLSSPFTSLEVTLYFSYPG